MHPPQDMEIYKMAKLIVVLLLLVCYTNVQARVTCTKTYKGMLCENTQTGSWTVMRHYKESGRTTITPIIKGRGDRQRRSIQSIVPYHRYR